MEDQASEDQASELLAQWRAGDERAANQLFGQYAAAWLAGPDLGERTRDDYAQILRDRINPALGPRS